MSDPARLRALLDAARGMSGARDLDALLCDILKSVRVVVGAEASSVFLPDPATEELVLHTACADHPDAADPSFLQRIRVPKGQGIAGAVFDSRQTINIRDAQTDPRLYRKADASTGFVTRAMVTAPLLDGNRCLGVIQILNPLHGGPFSDEDAALLEGFAGLTASTLVRLENQKQLLDQQKHQQELRLASEIQSSFLPAETQFFPNAQVHFKYFPAKEVGGDFVLTLPAPGDRLLVVLGDVSGKGIPAALTMARATAKIETLVKSLGPQLGPWVSAVNAELCADLKAGRFIGATFLLADPHASTVLVCNAGQFPPLRQHNLRWEEIPMPGQLPLGILPGYPYQCASLPAAPGDFWLLYTDGVSEARNEQGQDFTTAALLQHLVTGATSCHTLQHICDRVTQFIGAAPQHDDASAVLLDWRGLPPPETLHLECCTQTLGQGRRFIESWAKFAGFDDLTTGHLVLAVDEAATNVHRYAYHEKGGPLDYRVRITENALVIEMADQGTPCDTEKIKGRELDDLRPGGLGTVLLRQIFNSVDYQPHPAGTTLTLKKTIP